jgi:predicted transposase YdaD
LDLLCQLAGLPVGQAPEVVQPNVPPRTLDVDRAYRLTQPGPMVLHVEFESGHPRWRPERFLVYNALLSRQERCPVKTVVVVLRPDADSPTLTGLHRVTLPTGEVVHEWHYSVVRLWELPPDTFLSDPATMPLAALSSIPADLMPDLADRIVEAYLQLPEAERNELASNSAILAGLRFDPSVARQLFERAGHMRESTVYQEILREGSEKGMETGILRGKKATLIQLGEHRFGAPTLAISEAIEAITDGQRIDRINLRLFTASSWNDLLAVQ